MNWLNKWKWCNSCFDEWKSAANQLFADKIKDPWIMQNAAIKKFQLLYF